jgi:hypothetical protein
MNWPWVPLRRGDVAAILMVIVLLVGAAFVLVKFPYLNQASPNWGFGPGWNCLFVAKSEPVCIKEVPAKP